MSTVTEEPQAEPLTPVEELQLNHACMRVSFTWWGTKKALSDDQLEEAAHLFGADTESISASKKLINTKHAAYKAMTAIKRSIVSYWKASTLPYPEPGIRLLKHEKLNAFNQFMEAARHDLEVAAQELQAEYEKNRTLGATLGSLIDYRDYPDSVADLFSVSWNVENPKPPDYLLELNPEFYAREAKRVRAMFNNAVEMAEQEFASELSKTMDELIERLAETKEDGTPKVYRKDCVDKIREFIDRFKDLSIHSNDELEKLVRDCDVLTKGIDGETFRKLPDIRRYVAEKLVEAKAEMEKGIVIAPRRKITRRRSTDNGNPEQG